MTSQGKLFQDNCVAADSKVNLLPYDGTVNYFGRIFSRHAAEAFYRKLLADIPWQNDTAIMFGKKIVTARKVAWYGNPNFSYTYSGTTHQALSWTADLLHLKTVTEEHTGATYNSCLLNLYHSGDEGMGWHSDDEKSLQENSAIASLSFGAERRFCFRHKKSKDTIEVILEDASLLVMRDTTQTNWLHSVPKSKKIKIPRINLTFRSMVA